MKLPGSILQGRSHICIVVILFAVYLLNGIIAIPSLSITYDEMDHWSYGKRILMRKTDKIYIYDDASAMPISGLNAIPRAVQQLADPNLLKTDGGVSDIMNGRYATLIICLLTGFFIYKWSKELFGPQGALLSLFLFVFCPNLNGQQVLLTTDAYSALFTISTAYCYWKFIKRPGWKHFLVFSTSLALAQIVKYSMIHLFIFLGIISFFVLLKRRTIISGWKRNLTRLLVLGSITVVVINLGFIFNKPGKTLNDLTLSSKSLSALQHSFIGSIPLPIPEPYITGLDMTIYMNELGAGHENVSDTNYILGNKRNDAGFWYYYLILFIFKTPLTGLLVVIASIIFLFTRKKKQGHPSSILFILSLIFYFLLVLGIQSNVQIGMRHALMVYPLVHVLAGFISTLPVFGCTLKPLFATVVYSLTTYYYFFPNTISYSNELIPIKRNAYKIMGDSNLEMGQSWIYINNYLKQHPDVKIATTIPSEGKFLLGINDYLGLRRENKFKWLQTMKPVRQVDHSFLLFDVKKQDLEKLSN